MLYTTNFLLRSSCDLHLPRSNSDFCRTYSSAVVRVGHPDVAIFLRRTMQRNRPVPLGTEIQDYFGNMKLNRFRVCRSVGSNRQVFKRRLKEKPGKYAFHLISLIGLSRSSGKKSRCGVLRLLSTPIASHCSVKKFLIKLQLAFIDARLWVRQLADYRNRYRHDNSVFCSRETRSDPVAIGLVPE